jgi:PAS domain S-box-containing protein
MIARIAHDLGRCVETHRLRIEERGAATSMFLAMHDTWRDSNQMEHESLSPLVATPSVLAIVAAAVTIAIFVFDSATPVEVTGGVLYVAVVLMAVRFCQPRGVVIVAAGCIALTVLSQFLSPGDPWGSTALINRFLGVSAIVVTTFLALKNQSAQKALQRAEETIPGLVWSALPNGSRDFHSQSWLNFTGLSAEDAAGDGWAAFYHPEDRAAVVDKWRLAVATGEPFEAEGRGRSANGEYRSMLLRAAPLRDKGGTIVKWYGLTTDLEDLKRAMEELLQARTEVARVARVTTLGELTAAIAHEVQQPLTGLVSSGNACLRWLSKETPNLEAARRAVERIINDGIRAGEVVSRIRALVKKSPTRRDWLNINDTIREVIELIRSEVQRNRISLQTELSNDVPLALGDRIQLQQVILNMIMNAIEAMSGVSQAHQELSVASMKDGSNGVLVAVRDSGPGLDSTVLDRLFDAFYTSKSDGMGMGLAISRTIVEAHGGQLWATPNVPRGAIFQFRLPTDGEEVSSSKQMQSSS